MNSLWQIPVTFGDNVFIIPNYSVVYNNCHWHAGHGTKNIAMLFPPIIYAYNIKTILEIGLANGFLTQLLARGLASNGGGRLLSCDIEEQALRLSRNFSMDIPIEHITIIGDSTKIDFTQYASHIDMCCIDGDHSYEATKSDIMLGINLGAKIITVHDYSHDIYPEVFKAGEDTLKDWNKIIIPERLDTGDYAAAIFQRPQ